MPSEDNKRVPAIRAAVIKGREMPVEKADSAVQLPPEEFTDGEWIMHPVNMRGLKDLVSNSSILPQCIRAYKNNICGYGIGVRYVEDGEETEEMAEEFRMAEELIELLCTEQDTKEVFEDVVEARETYGIAYVEVIRDAAGNVVQVEFVRDTPSVWKTRQLDPFIETSFWHHGKETTRRKRYCKYVQQVGGKTVYFKEFGDPRVMDMRDGKYVEEGQSLEIEHQANELLEFAIGTEPYGEVRWMGQVLGVDGSRRAEELNNNYFRNGRHTPLMIMIHGGSLTDDSYAKLQEYMDDIKGEAGQHAFLLLETESTDGRVDFDNDNRPTVEIKDLAGILQRDELFQEYLDNNRRRAQSAFLLPDLYVGYTTDFNRATAQSAQEVTEEQVFQPERKSLAWTINNKLLNGYNFKHIEAYFLSPDISNPDDQYRLLMAANEAGGVTPNFAKKVLYEAYGEVSEDYPDGWGDMPLVYTEQQAQKEALQAQQAQAQQAQLGQPTEQEGEGQAESGEGQEGPEQGQGQGDIASQLDGQIGRADANGDNEVARILRQVKEKLREITKAEWSESDHPRDERGRFTSKPGASDGFVLSEGEDVEGDGNSRGLEDRHFATKVISMTANDIMVCGDGTNVVGEDGTKYHKADGEWYKVDWEAGGPTKVGAEAVMSSNPTMEADFFEDTFLRRGIDSDEVFKLEDIYMGLPDEMRGKFDEFWDDPNAIVVDYEGTGSYFHNAGNSSYVMLDLYDTPNAQTIVHEMSHAIDSKSVSEWVGDEEYGFENHSASKHIDMAMDQDKREADFWAMVSKVGAETNADGSASMDGLDGEAQFRNVLKFQDFMNTHRRWARDSGSLSCVSDAISGMSGDRMGESIAFGGHSTEYWSMPYNGANGSPQSMEYWANFCYLKAVKDNAALQLLEMVSPNRFRAAEDAYDMAFIHKKKPAKVSKADDDDGWIPDDEDGTREAARELEGGIGKALRRQIRKIAQAISDSGSLSEFVSEAWPWMAQDDGSDADEDIAKAFTKVVGKYMPAAVDRMIRAADPDLRLERLSKRMSAWMRDWSKELGRLMKLGTHEKVESVLVSGLEDGSGVEEVARRLQEEGIRDSRHRARRAARTEMLTANRAAQQEAFMQSPSVERKSWLHSGTHNNGNPRPNHMAISGQTVPKGEPFRLPGMDGVTYWPMYPGDTSLPASERVNCGCVCQPVVSEGVLGLPIEERKRLQEQALAEMDDDWERELDERNRAMAGIEEA